MSPTASTPISAARLRNYIDGAWQASDSSEYLPSRNPATGELLAEVPAGVAADVDAAIRAASRALPTWRATSPLQRARVVFAIRETLVAHRDELARLITTDMGKTLADARGEVGRGIESVEAACAMPHLLKGENLPGVAAGVDVELIRQPVGVVAAITPFNFPVMIPLWFLPYAIAAGNTFVLKPSEQDPLPARRLFELLDGVDELPSGVVNLVNGGRTVVEALLEHPDLDAVSFVGSAATARIVARGAAATGKRVQALGGAKNAMILMPDAPADLTEDGVLASAFGAAGQRCLAGSVAVLVGSRQEQDDQRERLVTAARALRTGDGADPATDICPLVSPESRERVEQEIDAALTAGAELALDGRMGGGAGGAELGATILDRVPENSRWLREEIFGPVLCLVRQPTLGDALNWMNEGRYGNAAVLFTSSGGAAQQFRRDAQAGMLGINIGVAAPVAWFPFAGWKDSFDGDLHANGNDAVEFLTRKKVVTSRWS